jgi:glycosyltransferase involved in cell wall biosynthesis
LRCVEAPRLLRYHNVTPPEFFADYSDHSLSLCRAGRAQTARLVALCGGGCVAASAYNADELVAAGADSVSVVPPFTGAGGMLQLARPRPEPPFHILFVGRLAPHKGHFDLLTTIAAYVATIGPAIRLTIVGGISAHLSAYRAALEKLIDKLNLRDHVELLDQVDEETLHGLFMQASLFLCMSEHEGFCVPIIEAQAAGVPVIAMDAAAVAETIGTGQMLVDRPRRSEDYLYIAKLIHAACTDIRLRRQVIAAGHRNVLSRFTPQAIAGRFMEALAPLLEASRCEPSRCGSSP